MRSFFARPALLLPLLLIPIAAYASTYVFAEARCKLWLPEKEWSRNSMREQGSPWVLAVVENDSATKTILAMATKIPMPIDSADNAEVYLKGLYEGMERGVRDHAKITHSGKATLGGIPAWEIMADEMSGGTSYIVCAVANERMYMIVGRWKEGNAGKDEILRYVVESFRFIGTPELPGDRNVRRRELPGSRERK